MQASEFPTATHFDTLNRISNPPSASSTVGPRSQNIRTTNAIAAIFALSAVLAVLGTISIFFVCKRYRARQHWRGVFLPRKEMKMNHSRASAGITFDSIARNPPLRDEVETRPAHEPFEEIMAALHLPNENTPRTSLTRNVSFANSGSHTHVGGSVDLHRHPTFASVVSSYRYEHAGPTRSSGSHHSLPHHRPSSSSHSHRDLNSNDHNVLYVPQPPLPLEMPASPPSSYHPRYTRSAGCSSADQILPYAYQLSRPISAQSFASLQTSPRTGSPPDHRSQNSYFDRPTSALSFVSLPSSLLNPPPSTPLPVPELSFLIRSPSPPMPPLRPPSPKTPPIPLEEFDDDEGIVVEFKKPSLLIYSNADNASARSFVDHVDYTRPLAPLAIGTHRDTSGEQA